MTPKITRTFRIPVDLVERFDRAAKALGVDKTQIVVEAIQKFVEQYEAGQLFKGKIVFIDKIYVPKIGLCEIYDSRGRSIPEGKTKVSRGLKALNNERKEEIDGKLVSYNIERVGAFIDFKNRVCTVNYLKCWIGGAIDKEIITFPIKWKEEVEEDDENISYITIYPEKDE